MKNETINFFVRPEKHAKKKKISWTFEHNLADYGLSLENAFICWAARTDNPEDPQDFIAYATDKDPLNLEIKLIK